MDNKSQLTLDAEKLLEQMKLGPPREPGERLRPTDASQILTLNENGASQTEIGNRWAAISREPHDYRLRRHPPTGAQASRGSGARDGRCYRDGRVG
jgi:hypothetical protein